MTKWIEVTRKNFAALLPQILEETSQCDFVAFDTELTGLQMSRAHRYSALDDLPARYAKVRDSCMNFGLLQVGLSFFRWNELRGQWAMNAYSFYVFPSSGSSIQQERRFVCQLGSIDFLVRFGFDFNKAFREGIPFITQKEETILRQNSVFYRDADADTNANANVPSKDDRPPVLLNDEQKEWIAKVFASVDAWLETKGTEGFSIDFDLPPMSSFQRLLVYQQFPLKYSDQLLITKKNGGVLGLRAVGADPKVRAAALAEEKAQFDKALSEQVGFRCIMDAISAAGKPIVGHNCWLDLMHFFHKFLDSQVPLQLADFKTTLHSKFPVVFDTKYLAKAAGIEETSLSDLTNMTAEWINAASTTSNSHTVPFYCEQSKESEPQAVDEEEKFHDAGFDSICTGQAFLVLLEGYLKRSLISRIDVFHAAVSDESLLNRLNVMQSDFAHLCLSGPEPEPDRSNVLHLSSLAPNTSTNDLTAALNGLLFGSGESVSMSVAMSVAWINDYSCFLQLESEEVAMRLLDVIACAKETKESATELFVLAPAIRADTYRGHQERRNQELIEQSENRKRPRRVGM